MFRWNTLKKIRNWLQKSVIHDGRNEFLAFLSREYVEEIRHSIQFQAHAERMHYPQFREKLLRIADEEQRHAKWLKARIIALGGEVPDIPSALQEGMNSWEHLRRDLEEEKRCVSDLTERLATSKQIDRETAGTLQQMLEEEKNHREVIRDMLMRSDPQAFWPI